MLDQMQKTISMSDLLADPARVVNDIDQSGTSYRIRRRGKRQLFIVDDQYLEGLKAQAELEVLHPNWREETLQMQRDFAAGRCWTLDEVMEEIRAERAAKRGGAKRAATKPRRRATKARTSSPNTRRRSTKRITAA